MLSHLYIENVAVIERAEIFFHRGLNVLTGETGAGKSIVIDAIGAILGQRTPRDLVRTGARSALISAQFEEVSPEIQEALKKFGCSAEEDGSLLLQREISAEGKGSCRVNGRPVAVSTLKEIGALLINIHGQHESYELLSPERHITYLDKMGDLLPLLAEYRKSFQELRKIKEELDAVCLDESEKERRMDLLNYQINELEAASIKPGEREVLSEQRTLYLNSERVANNLHRARSSLEGEENNGSAIDRLSDAVSALEDASYFFPKLEKTLCRIRDALYELEDCSSELEDASDALEYDPAELAQIEDRLDLLYRLSRKYGENEEEMLAFLEQAKKEYEEIELSDQRRMELESHFEKVKEEAKALARTLSQKRLETAKEFTRRVREELSFLNMPGVSLSVASERCPLNFFGCDKIEFLFSTNPGEPPKPISKIASGGELSRIMLAVKNVLADKDAISTLIFDEVDTGVSGSAAQKVGLKLCAVSRSRQVLCVTHLAQIAALGRHHYLIAKYVKDGRTFTEVKELDFEGRKRELARIIGGVSVTELTLRSAEEMLFFAEKEAF